MKDVSGSCVKLFPLAEACSNTSGGPSLFGVLGEHSLWRIKLYVCVCVYNIMALCDV